ncbi:MAG: hypothetical protein E7294_09020 [Lachnospiraceae bacterium]|nr:hypothetical protein [Lachnospiraceae bacterium]
MGMIYETAKEHGLALFPSGHRIICCDRTGTRFGRPVLLDDDYASQLNSILFEQTLYYVYQNTQRELILKNITSGETLLKIAHDYSPDLPRLTALGNRLLLFCMVRETVPASSRLLCFQPFTGKKELEICGRLPLTAGYSFCLCDQFLFLAVSGKVPRSSACPSFLPESPCELFGISADLKIFSLSEQFLKTESAHQTEIEQLKASRHDELEQLKSSFELSQKLAERKYALESEKRKQELELMKQTAQAELDRSKQDAELIKAQLDSAVRQYQELMDVASKYREEAAKWHRRCMKRRTDS